MGARQISIPSTRPYQGIKEKENSLTNIELMNGIANLKKQSDQNGAGTMTASIPSFAICFIPIVKSFTVCFMRPALLLIAVPCRCVYLQNKTAAQARE